MKKACDFNMTVDKSDNDKRNNRPNAKMAAKLIFICLCANQTTSLVVKELLFRILTVLTRLVRLISTKTKQYFFGRHLCIWSIISLIVV